MKILVIDDNPLHWNSARQTLAGHNVEIVNRYDAAYRLLGERYAPWKAVDAELRRRGFKDTYAQGITEEERKASQAEARKIAIELCPPPSFDAVLCDLLMHASEMTMGEKGRKYVGQEMPVGFALALMAVLHGVQYVAVATDLNHHDHPASAMLDPIGSRCPREDGRGSTPPRFVINGAKVGFYHAPMVRVEDSICTHCNGTGAKDACYCVERNAGSPRSDCNSCVGTGRICPTCGTSGKQRGKDWGRILQHLIETTPLTEADEEI